jgi:hypothetical protein
MRTHAIMRIILLTLALALPRAAPALDWGAYAGLDYSKQDRWLFDGEHATLTRLEYDLGVDGGGYVWSPSMARWMASVQYRHLAESNGDLDSSRASLTYRLRSVLFQDPRSPVRLVLQATRQEEDAKSDTTAGSSRANTTTAGADLRFTLPGRPVLMAWYQYFEREETGPLLAGANRTVHTVNAAVTHGTGAYDYSARYVGNFSAGTFDWDDYADHRADVDAQAKVTDSVSAHLSESYYRRVPTNQGATNLSQEFNSLSTVVMTEADARGQQRVGYGYVHALSTAPAITDRERAEQRLSYWDHRVFTGTPWQLYATGDVSLSEIRNGTTVERASGELVGVQAVWRRLDDQDLVELRLGPQLGARQPDSGSAEFGYGTTAGATAQHRWSQLLGSAAYDVAYESDLYAASGWSLRQNVLTTLASPLGVGQASAQLQASAMRRGGGLLGASASRSLTLQATYRWYRHQVMALAGLQDGVSGALGEPIRGDGLFLPAPYDTQNRYLTLTGTFGLTDYLWLSGRARASAVSQPDRADQSEQEVSGTITWAYAGIFLSLEDRYLVSKVGGGTAKDNLFIFRIRRGFGSRR